MTVNLSHPRAKTRWLALAAAVTGFTLAIGSVVLANHAGTVSGVFESKDGNLVVDHSPAGTAVDWNSFATATVADDWNFLGITDATGNPDSIFNGGVKQDHDCPGTKSGSLGGGDNKFDLQRIYLANKTIDVAGSPHEFLFLAWRRVDGSAPTASAHIGYEFNKGTAGTCTDSDLLKRVEGDMLVVYDFPGGTGDSTVRLSRWLTAGEGHSDSDCEVSNSKIPCWGNTQVLTDLGFADGKVNQVTVVDALADNEDISAAKFGEAALDLTAAGVFSATDCEGFGFATAVSRSSGNSGTAQMKDKVGPEEFTISNCGSITVEKVVDPTENETEFDFTIDPDPNSDGTQSLGHGDSYTFEELFAGDYTLNEALPDTWEITSIECDDGTSGNTATGDVTVTLEADENITCVYTNTRLTGSILVEKVDNAEPPVRIDGAGFTITPGDIAMTEVGTGVGLFCTDGLALDVEYTISETTVPDGYNGADDLTFTPDEASTCDERVDAGDEPDLTFVNSPAPGTITIEKVDDDDNPLEGVGFTLYVDDSGAPGTQVGDEEFTGSDGIATFEDVPLGTYCIVETSPLDGYSAVDPDEVCGIVVGLGSEAGEGATVDLGPYVNPQEHTVIVLVCHDGTGTLAPSAVQNGTGSLTTIGSDDVTDEQEALLCGLAGFSGKAHGDKEITVDVGSDAHP